MGKDSASYPFRMLRKGLRLKSKGLKKRDALYFEDVSEMNNECTRSRYISTALRRSPRVLAGIMDLRIQAGILASLIRVRAFPGTLPVVISMRRVHSGGSAPDFNRSSQTPELVESTSSIIPPFLATSTPLGHSSCLIIVLFSVVFPMMSVNPGAFS